MSLKLKPGDSARFYCEGCSAEFDIVYEPKAIQDRKSAAGMPSITLKSEGVPCPACGDPMTCEDEE